MTRQYFRFSLMREKNAIDTFKSDFHGIVLDAHILELYPAAVSSFISILGKPYILDPVFFKFGENFFPDFKEKRWVKPLTNEYGMELAMLACPDGIDSGFIGDPQNTKLMETVVKSVLDYQRTRLPDLYQSVSELGELSGDAVAPLSAPEFLVAPYQVCSDARCLKSNLEMLRVSLKHRKQGERVYAAVALTKDLLFEDEFQTTLADYKRLMPDGFLVWICDFREHEEDTIFLHEFEQLCKSLKGEENQSDVVNLFGGYYSAVLSARGFIGGSVQGVGGISEYRNPFAEGGGGRNRYYLRVPHVSVGVDLADDLFGVSRELFECGCPHCENASLPSEMEVEQLAKHAMKCRIGEFKHAGSVPLQELITQLNNDSGRLSKLTAERTDDEAPLASPAKHMIKIFSDRLKVWAVRLSKLEESGPAK